MKMGKVLIVEDRPSWADIIGGLVKEAGFEPIFATLPDEARDVFGEYSEEIVCVTMDGSLRHELDTLPLIAEMSGSHPIIGLSGSVDTVLAQMESAGCKKVLSKKTLSSTAFVELLQQLAIDSD